MQYIKQSRLADQTLENNDVAIDLIDQNGQLLGLDELYRSKRNERLVKFLNTNAYLLLKSCISTVGPRLSGP